LKLLSNPPIAGPKAKPIPNAIPIIPNALARFSFGVTSAIYAIAVGILEVVMPEMMRPRKSQPMVGASAMTT
jgi:hypothetical protein